jgi:hypothetical protein
MAAWLEHQTGPDPVQVLEKISPPLDGAGTWKCRAPPATTRTGLPQVWASTQKKVWLAMVSVQLEAEIGYSLAFRLQIAIFSPRL